MVEGARLESAYTEQFVSRVRIPSSLHFLQSKFSFNFFLLYTNNAIFWKILIYKIITLIMRNLLTMLMTFCMLSLNSLAFAQDQNVEDVSQSEEDTTLNESTDSASEESSSIQIIEEEEIEEIAEESQSFHYAIKEQFIQGGWQFMGIVLLCLILGLAVAIERIITLNLATTNTKEIIIRY